MQSDLGRSVSVCVNLWSCVSGDGDSSMGFSTFHALRIDRSVIAPKSCFAEQDG